MKIWNKNIALFSLVLFLTLFDFLFFNIRFLFMNITFLRIVILGIIYLTFLSILNNYKITINKKIINVFMFFVFWLVYHLFLIFWSPNLGNIYNSIYYLLLYILLIIVVIILINTKENVISINKIFIFFGIVSISIGILEYFTTFRLPISRYESDLVDNNGVINAVTAMFYNENNYSLFLMFIAPFLMVKIIYGKVLHKIINLIILNALIFIVIINDAKLILLALSIQFTSLIIVTNISKVKKAFLTLIVVVMTLILINDNLIYGYFNAYDQIVGGYGSNYIRYNLILSGFGMLKQSYFLGVGPNNYSDFINPYLYTGVIIDPHNWWIEILAEFGIFIFVGYVIFFFWMIVSLYKVYKKQTQISLVALSLFLGWLGFIIGSMAPSALFDFWPQWLMYGVSLAVINVNLNLQKEKINSL